MPNGPYYVSTPHIPSASQFHFETWTPELAKRDIEAVGNIAKRFMRKGQDSQFQSNYPTIFNFIASAAEKTAAELRKVRKSIGFWSIF